MTGAVFFLSLGLLCLIGAALIPKSFTLEARIALGTALILVLLTVEMLLFSAAGVPWSPIRLLVPLLLPLAFWRPRFRSWVPHRAPRAAIPGLCVVLVGLALTAYAAYSARMTSTDLLLFWGTKGEHFGLVRSIDTEFLRVPPHTRMHGDYPPLLTSLYAWGTLCAGRLPWGAVLLLAPFFLALGAVLVWDGARRRLDPSRAAEFTAIYVGLLGYCLFVGLTAGNAEPALLFYETVVLCAIVFDVDSPAAPWLAGLGMAGAVLTKVEGTLFAAVAAIVALWRCRPLRRQRAAICMLLPPLVCGTLWILFCASEGTLEFYRPGAAATFALKSFSEVGGGLLDAASYEAAYLPWSLLAVVWLARREKTEATVPLGIGAGYLVGIVGIYMTSRSRPIEWIDLAGARTLLTPLLCCFFAAAAPPKLGHG